MLETIIVIVILIIIALLVFAATKPDTFRVERSTHINAPPEKIFPLIDDFRQWEVWSPWEKVDPQIKRTYSGAASGKGAVYEWDGNKNIGRGRMEIVESSPLSKIVIKIDFLKPMEAHNTVEFSLHAQNGATTLTHAMFGPSPYLSKLMGVFCSMDKMVGQKFEEGLAAVKALAEQ